MDEWRWSRDPDGSYYAPRINHPDWVRAPTFTEMTMAIWEKMDGANYRLVQCELDKPFLLRRLSGVSHKSETPRSGKA